MALVLPVEAQETPAAKTFVDRVTATGGPIREAYYLDLRQSMRNGGGPACLRLRVVLTPEEVAAMGAGVLLDATTLAALEAVVQRRYRERLSAADLADPALLDEGRRALDEIGQRGPVGRAPVSPSRKTTLLQQAGLLLHHHIVPHGLAFSVS
jgi:succinylarginine dihydrolase